MTTRTREPQPTPVRRPQPTPVDLDALKREATRPKPKATTKAAPPPKPPKPSPKPSLNAEPAVGGPSVQSSGPRGLKQAPKQAPKEPKSKQTPKAKAAPTPVRRPDPTPTPVRIDPRIKRRRIEVTRETGRRRLRVVLITLGALAVVVGGVGATRSPLLDVDHIEVIGATRTPPEEVAKASGLERKPQLLDVDLPRIVRQVERLPWVLEATATRHWPATVKITVTERTDAASLPAEGGKWAVADGSGRVLSWHDGRPDAMPSIAGAEPAGAPGTTVGRRGRTALHVAAALPFEVRSMTVELEVSAAGEIDLRMRGGGAVRLGDTSLLDEKLQAAATVLGTLDLKVVKVLDVRVPRAPVLTRR